MKIGRVSVIPVSAILKTGSGICLLALAIGALQQFICNPVAAAEALLARHYVEGERVTYRMKAVNQGHLRTIRYEAQADGVVKKDASGKLAEEFGWSHVLLNGTPLELSLASTSFRQTLSLAPNYANGIPDLSKVQPILIGPIVDLLTVYADVSLCMSQPGLEAAGDHVYFKHGLPNSWADGTYTVLGEDAIDFDMTVKSVDLQSVSGKKIATVVVRHVPPANPQIKLPTEWMRTPVVDTPNNWVQVSKSDGKYYAEVGKEIFDVTLQVDTATGRLISATMENPVEVLARECADAALTSCGDPVRYQILRQVSLAPE